MNFAHHTVFGLSLRSNVSIPGLKETAPLSAAPDVDVHFGAEPFFESASVPASRDLIFASSVNAESGEPSLQVWQVLPGSWIELGYYDGLRFWVDQRGRNIWAKWPDTLTIDDVAAYVIGPVFGLVLQLRGITCLHASAVAFENHAVAFAGGDGAGKSTTAAAFARRGYAVISDDMVALVERDGAFYVLPAYPHLSLWQDSVELLYGPDKELPDFSRNLVKRRLALGANNLKFAERPLPLAAIFVLGERSASDAAPYWEDLPPQEALMSLIGNSFAGHLLDKKARAAEFASLGRVVISVPVKRLRPHTDPMQIQLLCDVIVQSHISSRVIS